MWVSSGIWIRANDLIEFLRNSNKMSVHTEKQIHCVFCSLVLGVVLCWVRLLCGRQLRAPASLDSLSVYYLSMDHMQEIVFEVCMCDTLNNI